MIDDPLHSAGQCDRPSCQSFSTISSMQARKRIQTDLPLRIEINA
jgi:hypothetical protein